MKIDKIVFCCSEEFSPFWNLQSFLWKEKLDIEPVCLLWGKVENTNMVDTYGEIIEKEYAPELIESFQMTWSKFFHTQTEPDTTWIIGDMDLIPLQTDWFQENIEDVPDDSYTHLAYGEIPRLGNMPLKTFEQDGGFVNGGMDLAAYYHVAKGSTFVKALGLHECSFYDQVSRVIDSGRFGMGPQNGWTPQETAKRFSHVPIPKEELYYWVADENYSSYRIFNALQRGDIDFVSHITPQGWGRDRLDRAWMRNGAYEYDPYCLRTSVYIDIHCDRPYDKQERSLREVIEGAWQTTFEDE